MNLYLAELNVAHAQREAAEFRHEVTFLRGLQHAKGFPPESVYAPAKTWIVEARDVTPLLNITIIALSVIVLIAAFAFYKGVLS